jgi:hypothetical protein
LAAIAFSGRWQTVSGAPPPNTRNPGAGEAVRGAFQLDLFGKKIATNDSRSDAIKQELHAEHRSLDFGAQREVRPASAD